MAEAPYTNKAIDMRKFQVTIRFFMDDAFMDELPEHRKLIDELIRDSVIDIYVVTMESLRVWITITAESKKEVLAYLRKSPLYRYWTYEIEEVYVLDGPHYRLPVLRMN
jgi:hypothetical protein